MTEENLTTEEVLTNLKNEIYDELMKPYTRQTGIVSKEQLLEIKRIAEEIIKEADLAIKHLE